MKAHLAISPRARLIISLLCTLVLAAIVVAAVDLSSPKSVAKSFYAAMDAGDTAAVRDCMLVQGDVQQKLAGALTDMIVAGKKLGDAAKEKFGPAGEKVGVGTLSREDAGLIDRATQTDDGETARLKLSDRGKPLTFRKTP